MGITRVQGLLKKQEQVITVTTVRSDVDDRRGLGRGGARGR